MIALTSRNLVQVFEDQVTRRGDATALTFKRGGSWQTMSWKELGRRVRDVADGLASLGVKPGDRVSILGDTCAEWIIADVAIMSAGAITVPIYQSNPAHEVQYVLQDAGSSWIFVDHDHQAAKIREEAAKLPDLKGVIRFFGDPEASHEHTLAAIENRGVAFREQNPGSHAARVAAVKPSDPASYLYTSGTTGNPKGVVLTHGAWTYEAEAIAELELVKPDDVVLLFLPMAHSFAKVIEAVWFGRGHGGLRRVDREDRRQRRRGPPHRDAGRAAHLREGLQRGGRQGARHAGGEGLALRAGHERVRGLGRRQGRGHGA